MSRRTAALSERVASIERDIQNASKAYPQDVSLANSARGLRKIVRELNAASLKTREHASDVALHLQPAGTSDKALVDYVEQARAIAETLSNAREGTI